MKIWSVQAMVCGFGVACALTPALAKLPPLSEAAKATAAAAAVKAAWSNKVATYQLCKAQDRVVAHYLSSAPSAGKDVKAGAQIPPCADPGPFAVAEAKPIEAAGAHSPAATSIGPPSTTQPDAVANPAKKP